MPAAQLTVVMPTGKALPDSGMHFTQASPPHTLVAVTANSTVARPWASASAPSGPDGQVSCRHSGPQLPVTITRKLALLSLLAASTATQLTGVRPRGNTLPEAGTQ